MKITKPCKLLAIAFSCFITTSVFASQPSHANTSAKPGKHSGLIKASKHIVNLNNCKNDKLAIKVKIPHKFKSFWNHEAEAHLVAAFPSDELTGKSEFISWNLRNVLANKLESIDEEEREHPLFKLDCDFLHSIPSGAYQFSIVLTVLEGDPINLTDWHHGLHGLLATSKIKINHGRDESDIDDDGEVDGDTDFDGLIDDDEDLAENEEGSDDEEQEQETKS